ncbi:hemolysin-type calcium-binding region [Chondrocystis sp. NIES-4102]|nr:hemolysin-type calcium-binding region [Chondrocystis sp. NIES-4102]
MPTPIISIVGSTAVEGVAPNKLNYTVSISEPLTTELKLNYSTFNGSAISAKDYTAITSSIITFAPGETVKNITVDILNDDLNEIDKDLFVNVFIPKLTTFNPSTTDLLVATAKGTITDVLSTNITTILADSTTTNRNTIESLTLTGTANINAKGNKLNNILTGNVAANLLEGVDGQDTLEGKGGADTLKGGLGNDTYIIDNTDIITEDPIDSNGIDTVQANFNYTLGENLENLVLIGTTISGDGNELGNFLTGNAVNNSLNGNDGNDTLVGNLGTDTLKGGLHNDTYIIDASDIIIEDLNAGIDTVNPAFTYTIANSPNLENIELQGIGDFNATGNDINNKLLGNSGKNILTGNGSNDFLIGNSGDDTLNGGDGNDQLEGGFGIDILNGNLGDDTYVLSYPEDVNDVISELAITGISDQVNSVFSYTLPTNLENLVLIGTNNINATGNSVANSLIGNAGNNILDGLAGSDIMAGGMGNDTYILDQTNDTVVEEKVIGFDTVESPFNYQLGNNLENLLLTGTAITGTGNELNNYLTGNNSNNSLIGNAGLDTLDGGLGNDTMIGGIGNDLYIVDSPQDTVTETSIVAIEIDAVESSASHTLSNNVENLQLVGTNNINGIGNSLNNKITGNSGSNNLDGGDGNDSLRGENDNDRLTGGIGNDSLDGGSGADTLDGGMGDDIYVIDDFRDVITTLGATDGKDLVQSSITYRLGSNLENLTLTGTNNTNAVGNELNNIMLGNGSNNVMDGRNGDDAIDGGSGNDVLRGEAGNDTLKGNSGTDFDTLIGSIGNDEYYVASPEDVIIENLNEGIDQVFSTASNYTLSDHVENLTLIGTTSINGTGNNLNNIITGNSGFNIIDGSTGNDTMIGGTGNDNYIVNNVLDVITETSSLVTEIDTAYASSNYTLSSNVENLILTGTANFNATGNSQNNQLIGNSGNNALKGNEGNDTLNGGVGIDTLEGGMGNDTYVIDNTGDLITELIDSGLDTTKSFISYTLVNNVENLVLLGSEDLKGTGNALNNLITGNIGNNEIIGSSGDDTLIGGAGNDILRGGIANDRLSGGLGADKFTYNTGVAFSGTDFGSDRIIDFNITEGDKIVLGKTTFGLTSTVGTGFSINSEFAAVATDDLAKGSIAKIVYSSETGNIFYNNNGVTLGGESVLTTVSTSLIATDFIIV